MFSTSALRFTKELADFDRKDIVNLSMRDPGLLEMYCIHHIESIVMLMGTDVESVMFLGTPQCPGYVIRFKDGRYATSHHFDFKRPFSISVKYAGDKPAGYIDDCKESDYFQGFVTALVKFFQTGISPVDFKETITVIAIRETLLRAKDTPGVWVDIRK